MSSQPVDRWDEIRHATYWSPRAHLSGARSAPAVVVVATRYGGVYEGGMFAAIPADWLQADAFGQDTECGDWWHAHGHKAGVGATPDAALQDWYEKR